MTLRFAAAVAFLAVTGPVMAQTASTGTPITDPNAPGTVYQYATHGDWEIRCVRTQEDKAEPCSMYQLLKDNEGNDVAEVVLVNIAQGDIDAIMTVTTPLRTLLTEQLAFVIEEGTGKKYPFAFCTQTGCVVRAALLASEVETMKAQDTAQFGVVSATNPQQVVQLNMSLKGFTAAYADVSELNDKERAQLESDASN